MELKDQIQLANWLSAGASLVEVESISTTGLVGNKRFTEAARRAYVFLWTWSVPRFSGQAGQVQDAIYKKHGMKALERRYARVQRIIKCHTSRKL